MSDGSRIKEVMDQRGVSTQELAHAAGVSYTAVFKWLRRDELGPGARDNAARGLAKVGIDPRTVWPDFQPSDGTMQPAGRTEELKALLAKLIAASGDQPAFSDDRLRALLRLLELEKPDQMALRGWIEGMLFPRS
jgi:transcriptional regulator with XRE-family HTH domain